VQRYDKYPFLQIF